MLLNAEEHQQRLFYEGSALMHVMGIDRQSILLKLLLVHTLGNEPLIA